MKVWIVIEEMDLGFVVHPWRIVEVFESQHEALKCVKAASEGARRRWIEQEVVKAL